MIIIGDLLLLRSVPLNGQNLPLSFNIHFKFPQIKSVIFYVQIHLQFKCERTQLLTPRTYHGHELMKDFSAHGN